MSDKPDNSIKNYTMTPEELQVYLASLPPRPKKVRSSELDTTGHQQGMFGGKHYRKKGGEH